MSRVNFTVQTYEKVRKICKELRVFTKMTIHKEAGLNYQTINSIIDYMLKERLIEKHDPDDRPVYTWKE